MDVNSKRWVTVADSPHDHEREALAFLRGRLPDRDPFKVWTNFEFTAPGGQLYEVDALVVADTGVYLVEIKSHPGSIGGDGAEWEWHTPQGRRRTFDNPRLLANRKAKALKGLLERTKAFRKHRNDVPWVTEAVFLSDPDLVVTLSPPGRHNVYGRDPEPGEETPRHRDKLGAIVDLLTNLDPTGTDRRIRRVDRPTGDRIVKAIEEVGIRERSSRRRIGDYVLGELLHDVEHDRDTGVAYQDFAVTHASLPDVLRRVRLYPLERNATTEQRTAAVRAARREFELLQPLRHPGIARPVDYTEHERGPALFFDHDPEAQPLHRWLADHSEQLTVENRLDVLRQIAEAVGHAHDAGVYHRALCPSAVHVAGTPDEPRVVVTNWHTGARVAAGTTHTTLSGTAHVEALAAGDAVLYRAPEANQDAARPGRLDVFSIGCLAAFLLTGEHPAPTPSSLQKQLAGSGHVAVEAAGDVVSEDLALFVAESTAADANTRLASIGDILGYLDMLEEEWTLPDAPDEPHVAAARRGETLAEERFEVLGRLGQGASAFALLARDQQLDRHVVLKVASDPSNNDNLAGEAEAIAQLNHPRIVQILDGPLDLDGHTALVLSYAGPEIDEDRPEPIRGPRTLADRIGNLGLEFTQRFGEDLLDALRHLEEVGVSHRDIKPANLGVTELGAHHRLHLVLFDFSLSRTPTDRIDAGTPDYIDPFLKKRAGWDPAADRYAAAVVLHEMLTGNRPRYGDGTVDAGLADAPLALDLGDYPLSVVDFFQAALAPELSDRHDTASDMARAWQRAWEQTDQLDDPADFEVPAATTLTTPLAGLPLSPRAQHALEKVDVITVGDLLDIPIGRIRSLRGVGTKTRSELLVAIAALRAAVEAVPVDTEASEDDTVATIASRLVPSGRRSGSERSVLGRYVGIDDPREPWPSGSDLARELDISRQRVSQLLAKGRTRWSKQPDITVVRNWLADALDQVNDLATVDQLADRLANHRPDPDDPDLQRHAHAVLRACLAVESDLSNSRWIHRRVGATTVVARRGGDDAGTALADYATALAERTDQLVAEQPIVSRSQLVAALRDVPAPGSARPLPDAHLAEVAATTSADAAVTNRLELYRTGLPAADAVREARRALLGLRHATVDDITAKVAARFPAAEPVPDRPELDQLLTDAGIQLRWDDDADRYESPTPPTVNPTATGSVSRYTTRTAPDVTPVEIDVAVDFDHRLRSAIDNGSLLVLSVDRPNLERAAIELGRHAITAVELDEWILDAIRARTASGRPSWEVVVEADAAGAGSPAWSKLQRLLDATIDDLSARLATTAGTVLVTHLGLLARFDRVDIVAAWRDLVHDRAQPINALWLLTTVSPATDMPFVDDRPIPVITANEHVRVPHEWLRRPPQAPEPVRADRSSDASPRGPQSDAAFPPSRDNETST